MPARRTAGASVLRAALIADTRLALHTSDRLRAMGRPGPTPWESERRARLEDLEDGKPVTVDAAALSDALFAAELPDSVRPGDYVVEPDGTFHPV